MSTPVLALNSVQGGPNKKLIRSCASSLDSMLALWGQELKSEGQVNLPSSITSLLYNSFQPLTVLLAHWSLATWFCLAVPQILGASHCTYLFLDTCLPALLPASSLCSNVISALGQSWPTLQEVQQPLPPPKPPLISLLHIFTQCFFSNTLYNQHVFCLLSMKIEGFFGRFCFLDA